MRILRAKNCGSTRVSRVQFGVPPNCKRSSEILFQNNITSVNPSAFDFGRDARNHPPEPGATTVFENLFEK